MTAKQNVLITGASRGLGLSIARRLIDDGYFAICVSRSKTPELSALLESSGAGAFFPYDFSVLDGIHPLVRDLTKAHGRIYGLVNNAAVGDDGVLATMHESEIARMITVNLTSTILLTKYASRSMLLNNAGRIINVSSIIASTGFNGLSVYAASKAGLIGFTKSLARELGKANITVNALAPGYMETDMTKGLTGEKLESIKRRSPLGRLAGVDDVAAGVSFLMRPEARSLTGTVLTIDAGSTA